MKTYADYSPTSFDTRGLALDDRQDWLVAPAGQNRDSDCLERSNFRVLERDFSSLDADGNDYEVHRFGHWACGWFEIIIVRPGSECAKSAEEWESALADYPVADESDFSELETEEAEEVWARCYDAKERLDYIRRNRRDFERCNPKYYSDAWRNLLANVRGKQFDGCASELLS